MLQTTAFTVDTLALMWRTFKNRNTISISDEDAKKIINPGDKKMVRNYNEY